MSDLAKSELSPRESDQAEITVAWSIHAKYSAILFLVFVAYLEFNAQRMLHDQDTYWHIVVGRSIWQSGELPTVDQYSHTLGGARWIAKEWLSQLMLYGAYALGSWPGVTLLTAVVAATSYAVLFSWLQRRLEPIVALTLTLVSVSLTVNSLLARPQIFYYLLLTLCVCGLTDAVERKRTPWWLIPLVALWANVHASFPIAIILSALFGFEAIVSARPEERSRQLVRWPIVTLGAAAATGLTPYGFEPLLVSMQIAGTKATDYINEWQPAGFTLHGAYGAAFLIGSLAIVLASGVSRARVLPLLVCGGLMLRHVRFFSLFGIVASAALAGPVAKRFRRFASRGEAPSAAVQRRASIAVGAAIAAVIGVLALGPRPVPPPNLVPSAALEAAREYGASGPVFNDYMFGGYLIFAGVKTFMDGRAELYFNGLFEKTHDAELGSDDAPFLQLLDRYHVTWALLMPGSAGIAKLSRSPHWKEIYQDEAAFVFVKLDD